MTDFASWLNRIAFRLRLLRMALSPVSAIPAAVVMALDEPAYDFAAAAGQLSDASWPAV
jgi:hypothetical protein